MTACHIGVISSFYIDTSTQSNKVRIEVVQKGFDFVFLTGYFNGVIGLVARLTLGLVVFTFASRYAAIRSKFILHFELFSRASWGDL